MSTECNAQRVAILVDTSNIYRATKLKYQARIDYKQLRMEIAKKRPLVRAIAFVEHNEDMDVTPFLDALQLSGFETRIRYTNKTNEGKTSYGTWNVGIALHAVQLMSKVDCIAIVSGNGYLVDLLDFLSQHGVRSEVYGIENFMHRDLVTQADESFTLSTHCILK